MKSPIEDTIWGASYGSVAAVRAAFDRFGAEYHEASLASGVPAGAARMLVPHLAPGARGVDFGCGSGALGLALREAGVAEPLDGLDVSPGMLDLARATGCYRHLHLCNLLLPEGGPALAAPYDFAVSVGLIGDYVPYYLALPQLASAVRAGGHLGFAVESRSTPWRPLEKLVGDLGLALLSETALPVPEGKLLPQVYYFFVAQVGG